ncbi:MAG: amidohydrolase family protein [Pseudomonadales bacterium]
MRKLVIHSIRLLLIAISSLTLVVIALVLTAKHFDQHSLQPAPDKGSIVLDNVNIVPISRSGIIYKQKIVIRHGVITAVESAGPPYPSGLEVKDFKGAFLTPGLIDMHVHIDDREQLRLALSYGVTAVRNMDGMPMHTRWIKELNKGDWMGATLYSTSPSIHGENHSSPYDIRVEDPEHASRLVRRFVEDGWDQIKVYSGLGLEEFKRLIEDSDAAGIGIVGHVPYSAVNSNYSLSGRMKSIEHVEEIFQGPLNFEFDVDKLDDISKALATTGSVVCPTLSTFEYLTRISDEKEGYVDQLSTKFMTPFGAYIDFQFNVSRWLSASPERAAYNKREFEFLGEIVNSLDQHNVQMIAGTDAGTNFVETGSSMVHELILMRDAGLSPQRVLETATINAAKVLGKSNTLGTVELGKIADFILVSQNPLRFLETMADPVAVVKGGNVISSSGIVSLRSGDSEVAGWWVSAARYIEGISVRLFY